MKIRNGERIDNFKSRDALVLPRQQLNTGMLTWGDIVLCAKWSCENCEVPDEPTPTIPDNPKTADLPISIIMSIGLCAFGLSLFQYKLLKMTK